MDIYQVNAKKRHLILIEPHRKIKETKTLYKIPIRPKKHFVGGSFQRVNNKTHSIIYGQVKPEYINHMSGSGIFDSIKNFFRPRQDSFNNATTKKIKEYGDIPIEKMNIYRTPLDSLLTKTINAISFGQWNKLSKQEGFDKFYHLALVLTLANNKNVIVEKVAVIEVKDKYMTNSSTEICNIPNYTAGSLTLNTLFKNAMDKVPPNKFFTYDPLTNNCQVFIKMLLENSGLYNADINKFLFQNIDKIVEKLNPITKAIMRGTTAIAGTVDKIIGNGDIKRKK